MKKIIYIGLLGIGTVGSGVVEVLHRNASTIERRVGVPVKIKTILEKNPERAKSIATYGAAITTDINDILNDKEIDIVIELIGGINPALDFILRSLNAGKHVVTANKDLIAQHGRELLTTAEAKGLDFMFEASVGGAIPIIRPLKQCLAANRITEIIGIINGTTNYMLTKMTKENMDFADVLAEAQAKGYAEANPTADVEGYDPARKIAILASIAFNSRVTLEDVYVEGITNISSEDIEAARELGYTVKLLAIAKEDERGIDVRVHPAFIPDNHPLAAVSDVFNAIYVKGNAVGETMFYGRGAGSVPTASAILGDVIDISRNILYNATGRIHCTCYDDKPLCPIGKIETPYYIRLLVEDKPGVFAAIAKAFGDQQVSLHSVMQKRKVDECAEIVLITYRVSYDKIMEAMKVLNNMSIVVKVSSIIRVEAEEIA